MHSARVDKLFAALSIAGFVGLCVAPSDVWAQEPLALAKFSAGNVGGIYAFSGNLDAPGWLVRGQFTYVGYYFSSPLAA